VRPVLDAEATDDAAKAERRVITATSTRPGSAPKAAAIERPALVTGKGSRHPADSQMAAEVISRTPQPSTTQDERRDRAVTTGGKPNPANDGRKPEIVTSSVASCRPRSNCADGSPS
jgi:hypothetical protein